MFPLFLLFLFFSAFGCQMDKSFSFLKKPIKCASKCLPVWRKRGRRITRKKKQPRNARGSPLGGMPIYCSMLRVYFLIMTFPIVQMVSCRGPPQNTGPQAIACLACPLATPLCGGPDVTLTTLRVWPAFGTSSVVANKYLFKYCLIVSYYTFSN